MKTIEKLTMISKLLGFPFAINNAGYDSTNDNLKGLQAWSYEEGQENQGVEIDIFETNENIEDFDENCLSFRWVKKAEFFEIDNEIYYF